MRVNPIDTQVYNAAYYAQRRDEIRAAAKTPEARARDRERKAAKRYADRDGYNAYMRAYNAARRAKAQG